MLDVNSFYRQLGCTRTLNADEQLLLEGQVRVLCTQEAATAVFESLSTGEDKLDAIFEACRLQGGVLPFTTRSGHLAVRVPSEAAADETQSALDRLRAVMAHLQAGEPRASS